MVTPVWRDATWYGPLLSCLVDYPVLLNHDKDLFAREGKRINNEGVFNSPPWRFTAAWRVSGDAKQIHSFRQRLREAWKTRNGPRRVKNLPFEDAYAGTVHYLRVPFRKVLRVQHPTEPTSPKERATSKLLSDTSSPQKNREVESDGVQNEVFITNRRRRRRAKAELLASIEWRRMGEEEVEDGISYVLENLDIVTGSWLNRARKYRQLRREIYEKESRSTNELPTPDSWIAEATPKVLSAIVAIHQQKEELYDVEVEAVHVEDHSSDDDSPRDVLDSMDYRPEQETTKDPELKKMYTVAQIFGRIAGVPLDDILTDSCASLNTIDAAMYKLLKSRYGAAITATRFREELNGIGKGHSIGYTDLDVEPGILGGRKEKVRFSIVPDLVRAVLLGTPGIDAVGGNVMVAERKFTYRDKNGDLLSTPLKVTMDERTILDEPKPTPTPVHVAQRKIYLPPHSVTHVKVRPSSYAVSGQVYLMEGDKKSANDQGIWCANQMAKADTDGCWKYPVANMTSKTKVLKRGTLLGHASVGDFGLEVKPVPEVFLTESKLPDWLKSQMDSQNVDTPEERDYDIHPADEVETGLGQLEIGDLLRRAAVLKRSDIEANATPREDGQSYERRDAHRRGTDAISAMPDKPNLTEEQN